MEGDVLSIEQKTQLDITLDALDPKEECIKPKLVGQTVSIHVGMEHNQTTKIGSLMSQVQNEELGFSCSKTLMSLLGQQ